MRSFGSLAFRQVRARRLRALLTAAGIVLGVGMILGVLLLAVTIHRTFNDLFDSVYGRTDLVVSGSGSPVASIAAPPKGSRTTSTSSGGYCSLTRFRTSLMTSSIGRRRPSEGRRSARPRP